VAGDCLNKKEKTEIPGKGKKDQRWGYDQMTGRRKNISAGLLCGREDLPERHSENNAEKDQPYDVLRKMQKKGSTGTIVGRKKRCRVSTKGRQAQGRALDPKGGFRNNLDQGPGETTVSDKRKCKKATR